MAISFTEKIYSKYLVNLLLPLVTLYSPDIYYYERDANLHKIQSRYPRERKGVNNFDFILFSYHALLFFLKPRHSIKAFFSLINNNFTEGEISHE
jgi:hypothetical protein